jgi:hypothetical protein
VAEQAYSLTPRLPLFMTPLFNGIIVPGVNFSQPEPQNISLFTDFGSDLRENRAFWGKVCSQILKSSNLSFLH